MAGCPLLGPYAHLNPEGEPADPGPRTVIYHPFLKLHGEMEAKSKGFGFHLEDRQEGLTGYIGDGEFKANLSYRMNSKVA